MRFLMALVLLAIPSVVRAQLPKDGKVTIGTVDSVKSAVLNETRRFLVSVPASYRDTSYLPRRYPVLYLLDGDAHFHSVTGLLQILGGGINGTFVVPEMIVVAIPNTDRTRDLTPINAEKGADGKPVPFFKTSGGNPAFFKFIETELIPKIESDYRTAPYRLLIGHSFGGITAINALYTIPQTFNSYIAIDPSLWFADQYLLKKAKDVVSRPGLAGRTLFVGQANTINPDDTTANLHHGSIEQFNSILATYNRSGLRYAYKYYPDDDHGSVPLIAEYDALRFIFAPYRLQLMRALDDPKYLAEHFQAVSTALGYQVAPPEAMVDLLAQFAMTRDTSKAVSLYRLNAANYPTSPKGWAKKVDALTKSR